MKILLDMNLSPVWVEFLKSKGFEPVHWSSIGKADAPDSELLVWALENGHVVLTHDLDFGDILASTNAHAPSVIQIRTQNLHPDDLGSTLVLALNQFSEQLNSGALVVVGENKSRARILPLRR